MKTQLRKFPYPYRCALSICNDIDETSEQAYKAQHAFLATSEETPLGRGLDLAIGNSFWFYNENPERKNQVTYFQHKETILPRLKKGDLDVLHAYGDFNFNPRFTRKHAIDALRELQSNGISVRVWVNHGSEHNLQNVERGLGDKPFDVDGSGRKYAMPEYHTDLTTQYGIKFFWIDRLTEMVGQNCKLPLWEYYGGDKPLPKIKRGTMWMLACLGQLFREGGAMRRKLNALFGCDYFGEVSFNRLMNVRTLRDGNKVYDFVRFGNHRLATADDIGNLLTQNTLEKLIRREGTLIFYTHLGKSAQTESALPPRAVEVFRLLKRYGEEKKIWITCTSKLLYYNMIYRSLRWKTTRYRIDIECVDDEVFGRFVPKPEELDGITFYTDTPEKTSVYVDGRKIETVQVNEKDGTLRKSMTLCAGTSSAHTGKDSHQQLHPSAFAKAPAPVLRSSCATATEDGDSADK